LGLAASAGAAGKANDAMIAEATMTTAIFIGQLYHPIHFGTIYPKG